MSVAWLGEVLAWNNGKSGAELDFTSSTKPGLQMHKFDHTQTANPCAVLPCRAPTGQLSPLPFLFTSPGCWGTHFLYLSSPPSGNLLPIIPWVKLIHFSVMLLNYKLIELNGTSNKILGLYKYFHRLWFPIQKFLKIFLTFHMRFSWFLSFSILSLVDALIFSLLLFFPFILLIFDKILLSFSFL